jgi:hypothetical protein
LKEKWRKWEGKRRKKKKEKEKKFERALGFSRLFFIEWTAAGLNNEWIIYKILKYKSHARTHHYCRTGPLFFVFFRVYHEEPRTHERSITSFDSHFDPFPFSLELIHSFAPQDSRLFHCSSLLTLIV